MKKVSVLGLGYVGTVTAACLADEGYGVVGVDLQKAKVQAIARGISPIVEPDLSELLAAAYQKGHVTAAANTNEAVLGSDATIVCVGTPSRTSGMLNLDYVETVAEEIGEAIALKESRHLVVFRSTMLPGSTRQIVGKYMKKDVESGKLEVWFVPEFLREATAVSDFRNPSLSVIGVGNGQSTTWQEGVRLFARGEFRIVSWEVAETLKYACNSFHALKVAFANEIGRVGKTCGVDARLVMELLCQDTQLNISPYYLKPGNPYGGSCLPKDVAALRSLANQLGVSAPLISALAESNRIHQEALVTLVTERPVQRIGILGLAFKNATDDLRNSSMVTLAETLIGRGYDVEIYDPYLIPSRLVGSNRETAIAQLPHLDRLLSDDCASVISHAQTLVAAQKCVPLDVMKSTIRTDHRIIDVNGWTELRELGCDCVGFCW